MGKIRTYEVDRPNCVQCLSLPAESMRKTKLGFKRWRKICRQCRIKKYRAHKKQVCEFCGFVAIHTCQLDVDHINGNHKDNTPLNLQTLCANCHRLKTHLTRKNTQI